VTTYGLYLESGPKRRKTMVHALDLLGCVAVGPTTEEALAATPEAIRAYLRFLRRHGEAVEPEAPFATRVVEHVTEGDWLGNGSPYISFGPDAAPIGDEEIAALLPRLDGMLEELATWAEARSEAELEAVPERGRTGRAVLLHVLGAQGAYLATTLRGAPGFSALHGAAERGEVPLPVALRRAGEMVAERIWRATPEERAATRELSGRTYTMRKAMRRMLEHDWEHLAELFRRPGGPAL
jgi:predicted RNase H-like HicB family nuclease